ncbi:sulfatase [Endozoicomonas lisbonensis]|uniref:N-sulfoglucosamine sulfohydrolase n=1 Tax=Endozoicomonas lisbonensis TaxID=3120522 RepID=A0ABV2SKK2_9GAMM
MKKCTSLLAAGCFAASGLVWAESAPVNVMLITADDLGYEAYSLFDNELPNLTPNMDRFARKGVQFANAHVNHSICMPSRSVMATGMYSSSSGMMGFMNMKEKNPTVMSVLADNGYRTGVLGKVTHSTPDLDFSWDYSYDADDLGSGRSPELYYQRTKTFIKESKKAGQPFYLMVNSHDPHRVFHDPEDERLDGEEIPSQLYQPDQVTVPSYLPDYPEVRLDLSHYYNSVRRLDDTFGRVMEALEETGQTENTLVMFVSDNGSPFPFAKANTYLASTRTPLLVQWPGGNLKNGKTDVEHMVSTVDLMPTILDAAGIDVPGNVDGTSFLPVLRGEKQEGRGYIFAQIDYKIGGPATPMRAVQSKHYGYIFNPFTGFSEFRVGYDRETIDLMMESGDKKQVERAEMFRKRVLEEFYDLENDPGNVNNLIDHPDYQDIIKEYRSELESWMQGTEDPVLDIFQARKNPEKVLKMMETHYPSRQSLMPEAQLEANRARQREARARRRQQN